jgi:hypothetical protein
MRRTYSLIAAFIGIGLSVASCTTTQEQKVANTLTDLQIAANAYAAACAVSASTSGPCKASVAKTVNTAAVVAGAAKATLQ